VFQGRKIGFARLALRQVPGAQLWEIESESALRLRFLGVDKKGSGRITGSQSYTRMTEPGVPEIRQLRKRV
jgi:hypothetical protein